MSEVEEFTVPVVQLARDNDEFRKVIWTGEKTQLVLMAIPAGSEIGGEVHEGHNQLPFFVTGKGKAKIGDEEMDVADGDVSIVPSGKVPRLQEHRQRHAAAVHDLLAAGTRAGHRAQDEGRRRTLKPAAADEPDAVSRSAAWGSSAGVPRRGAR